MDIQAFISLVQGHKCLWDQNDVNYHSRDIQRQSWEVISEEMGIPVDELRKKWRMLRDTFVREVKKCSITDSEPDSKWVHFKELMFLRNNISRRDLTTSTTQTQTMFDVKTDEDHYHEWESGKHVTGFEYTPTFIGTSSNISLQNDESTTANTFSSLLKRKRQQSNEIEATVRVKEEIFDDDNVDNSDTQFLLSLRPYLNAVPKRRKLIVRTKLEQVFIDEQNL